MGRPRSPYWQYVTPTKTKGEVVVEWQCNFCKRKFKASASRIKPHLEGIKNQGISICEKIEEYRCRDQRHDNNTANSNNPQEGGSEHAEARLIDTTQEGNDALINTQGYNVLMKELILYNNAYFDNDETGSAMLNNPLEAVDDNNISLSIPSSSEFHSLTSYEYLQLYLSTASFEKLVTGQADIGVTSPCSATNINPPEGHGESPRTMDPNWPPSDPDIATSSHRQPQAGIAAEIMNPAGSGIPRPTRAQINANTNTPTSDDDAQLAAYYNSGTQHVQGLTNQTGYVKGNANGAINFGSLGTSAVPQSQSVADLQAKVDALQRLVGLVDLRDDGRTENASATQPNSSGPTPLRGESHGLGKYSNTGEQTIKRSD